MSLSNLLPIGLLFITWSAYSATFRFHAAIGHVHGTSNDIGVILPPLDVIITCCLGFVLSLIGAMARIPSFTPIQAIKVLNKTTRDEFVDRPSFRRYSARAAHLAKRVEEASW
jgi:hypothetical protein